MSKGFRRGEDAECCDGGGLSGAGRTGKGLTPHGVGQGSHLFVSLKVKQWAKQRVRRD